MYSVVQFLLYPLLYDGACGHGEVSGSFLLPQLQPLNVSCRGTGQQWPATGTGALGAAELGVAYLEKIAINPTIEPPELPQDWGNRLLEGTNKTLCTPGPRGKE